MGREVKHNQKPKLGMFSDVPGPDTLQETSSQLQETY